MPTCPKCGLTHTRSARLCKGCSQENRLGTDVRGYGPDTWDDDRDSSGDEDEDDDLRADGGTITCCPECDDYDINRRNTVREESERYRCYRCGATFAEPATRRKRSGHGPPHGTARKLLELDPDDVSRDDGLQADGGSHVWGGPGDTGVPPDVREFREGNDE